MGLLSALLIALSITLPHDSLLRFKLPVNTLIDKPDGILLRGSQVFSLVLVASVGAISSFDV